MRTNNTPCLSPCCYSSPQSDVYCLLITDIKHRRWVRHRSVFTFFISNGHSGLSVVFIGQLIPHPLAGWQLTPVGVTLGTCVAWCWTEQGNQISNACMHAKIDICRMWLKLASGLSWCAIIKDPWRPEQHRQDGGYQITQAPRVIRKTSRRAQAALFWFDCWNVFTWLLNPISSMDGNCLLIYFLLCQMHFTIKRPI